MGPVSRAFYFFAPYTDADERAVGLFFKKLDEHSDRSKLRGKLDELLQRDIAALNLWTEYRYKGYKYLRKSQRRKLYANLQLITDDFERFRAANTRPADMILAHIHRISPHAKTDAERAVLLQTLMDYFSRTYEYRASSSFGRLLRDPAHEKLVGDCNQIVTLYIYLYSRYFDVRDLQVRLLPGHVALHYGGVDIETTSGHFAGYDAQKGNVLLPIEEIVSVNLLDTTDSYLATHAIAPEDFLQASRFAYALSHERDIVTHNLEAAYGSLINTLMKKHDYAQALKFAAASRDMTLLGVVGHNGAVYELQRHNFAAARRFAKHAPERDKLIQDTYHNEGIYHFNARRYHEALKAFKRFGDRALVRRCYEALFYAEQEKFGKHITSETIKKNASIIKRMRAYAQKSGNKQLLDHVDGFRKYL